MALITCSECDKSYSDKADACPSCGCPTNLQLQASSESQEETTKPKTTQTQRKRPKNQAFLGLGITIFGILLALSSFLITGTQRNQNWTGGSRGYRYTWITRSKGEEFAANGFLAIGALTAISGIAYSLASLSKQTPSHKPSTSASPISDNEPTILSLPVIGSQEVSYNKRELFNHLTDKVRDNQSGLLTGAPSLDQSIFLEDEVILISTVGITICRFRKVINDDKTPEPIWQLYDNNLNSK